MAKDPLPPVNAADAQARAAVVPYLEPGEELRAAIPSYTDSGLGRMIVGVTDRRVFAVRSAYWTLKGRALKWSEPLDGVALKEKTSTPRDPHYGIEYGTYVTMRRKGGRITRLYLRGGFFTARSISTDRSVANLYYWIPGRF